MTKAVSTLAGKGLRFSRSSAHTGGAFLRSISLVYHPWASSARWQNGSGPLSRRWNVSHFLSDTTTSWPRDWKDFPPAKPLARWWTFLEAWECGVPGPPPAAGVARDAAGLKHTGVMWLMTLGLVEEDTGFGTVFEIFRCKGFPTSWRPTPRLLAALLATPFQPGIHVGPAGAALANSDFAQVLNPEAPRQDWTLQVPGFLWDVLRGSTNPLDC